MSPYGSEADRRWSVQNLFWTGSAARGIMQGKKGSSRMMRGLALKEKAKENDFIMMLMNRVLHAIAESGML